MGLSGSKGKAHKTAKVHSRSSLLAHSHSTSAMSGQGAADEFTICRILVPSRIIEHYLSEATSLLAAHESAKAQAKGNSSSSSSSIRSSDSGDTGGGSPTAAAVGAFLPKLEVPVRPFAEEYEAAVLFADISGFSKLAEALQVELSDAANAAEDLSNYVGSSLNMMVERITGAGGYVIKFAGDAILAVFPTGPKTDLAAATLIACQVALELLTLELHAGGVKLSVHCGVGAGSIMGYHIGGLNNRWEYFISGQVIEQIGSAEKEAEAGEVVISREAFLLLVRGVVGMMPKSAVPMQVRNLIREADKRAHARLEETVASAPTATVDKAVAKQQSEGTVPTAVVEGKRSTGDHEAAVVGANEAKQKTLMQQEENSVYLSELCTKLAPFARAATAPKASTHHRRTPSSMQTDEESIPIHTEVMTSGTGNYKLLAINVTGRLLSAHAAAKVRSQELLAALQPQSSTCHMVVKALKSYIPGPVLLSISAKQSVWSAQVRHMCCVCARVCDICRRYVDLLSHHIPLVCSNMLWFFSRTHTHAHSLTAPVLDVYDTLHPSVRDDV